MDLNNLIIHIHTAPSAQSTCWTAEEMTWPRFVERLKNFRRTAATADQYALMTREERSRAKNVGGYLGGRLRGTQRRKAEVIGHGLLTLDVDEHGAEAMEALRSALPNTLWIAHTTHSSRPDAQRWRIIIPLKREVAPTDFERLTKAVTAKIGASFFDECSSRPAQFMYWPSCPADMDVEYAVNDGDLLDPDSIDRHDFHSSDSAPSTDDVVPAGPAAPQAHTQPRAGQKPAGAVGLSPDIPAMIAAKGNPRKRKGFVGAFCRAYGMRECIQTFLSDVYVQTSANRYRHIPSDSTAGAVVYDDTWLYSFHNNDPAGGRLCNVFDLLRIHVYGKYDESAKANTPIARLPSYTMARRFAENDERTRIEMTIRDGSSEQKTPSNDKKWRGALDLDRSGRVRRTLPNMVKILLNDRKMRGIRFDGFAGEDIITTDIFDGVLSGQRTDETDVKVAAYLTKEYSFDVPPTPQKVDELITGTRRERYFNPVREYIAGVKWDGVHRAERVFIDFLNADDTTVNRRVTLAWLVAAVARAFEPGCKFDPWLTFTGEQGIGKSTILERLAWQTKYFNNSFSLEMRGKEAAEQLRGCWIIELGELQGISSRKDMADIKAFQSSTIDRYRAAYARNVESVPRTCVFACTTNESNFLKNTEQGNRRWWIMPVKSGATKNMWKELTPDYVRQIWAEAYQNYLAQRPRADWGLLDKESMAEMAARQQESAAEAADPLRDDIIKYLTTLVPANFNKLDPWSRRNYIETVFNRGCAPQPGDTLRRQFNARQIMEEMPLSIVSRYDVRYINRVLSTIPNLARGTVNGLPLTCTSNKLKGRDTAGWRMTDLFIIENVSDDNLAKLPDLNRLKKL